MLDGVQYRADPVLIGIGHDNIAAAVCDPGR